MPKTQLRTRALPLTLFLLTVSISALSQTTATPSADSKSVPVIDGGLGPCSADFTVTDAAGAPVYAAKIKVHIAYGFMSARKLDLEVGTNSDGKARFTGLPDHLKRGLFFEASEADRTAEAFDDPAITCKAQFTVALRKPSK
jgi:ABC-type Fe3+-hydroxamate transport system substrate-binding protein